MSTISTKRKTTSSPRLMAATGSRRRPKSETSTRRSRATSATRSSIPWAGWFGAGGSWVFIALHTFGGMPGVLTAIGTAGFCGLLALYPALAGWLSTHWTPASSLPRLIAAAAAWTLCEWLRSWLLSGFGWLSVGYAQVQSPLAGYAPIGGVFLT